MRTALAMGAAKGVLVSDPALQGSDALTTAKVLAAAVSKLGGADLIIAATESSDGYTGTVPEQLAEVLGLPSVTFAKKVVVDGGTLKVDRQTEEGYDEVTCPLPALISVTAGVVEPRYPSFKGIMAAKSKPIDTVTAADLGVTPGRLGRRRSGASSSVAQAEARAAGEIIEDDGEGLRQDRGVPREPEGHLRSDDHEHLGLRTRSQRRPHHGHARTAHQGTQPSAGHASPRSSAATPRPSPRALGEHGATQGVRHRRSGRQAARRRRVGGDEGRHRRWRLARPDHVPAELRGSRRDEPPVGEARPHGAHQQRRHHRRRRCRSASPRPIFGGNTLVTTDVHRRRPAPRGVPSEELRRRVRRRRRRRGRRRAGARARRHRRCDRSPPCTSRRHSGPKLDEAADRGVGWPWPRRGRQVRDGRRRWPSC